MCCIAQSKLTKKFLQDNKYTKFVTVFKVLKRDEYAGKPYLKAPYRGTEYIAGEYSVEGLTRARGKECDVSLGIHVYLDKKSAEKLRRQTYNSTVVEMTALVQDVIGVGDGNHAVFRRVYFSQSEYDRKLKGR
jgi:hypothetical protein